MDLTDIARELAALDEKIVLVYAFNSKGKTRLSVAFKDITKDANGGSHAGVYYNAYSEDLFVWDNDTENAESNIILTVNISSLNIYHATLTEVEVRQKLEPYKPKYDFTFNTYDDDAEKGIESIEFYPLGDENSGGSGIKISRGEERIFVWCFFLALFDIEEWAGEQSQHIFIDDPVSSLDDHNIFVTAATIFELIENNYEKKKIVMTTHHMGLCSILFDWLTKGEKADKYKKATKCYFMSDVGGIPTLQNPRNSIMLYHLHLLRTLKEAYDGELHAYHFALLRQALENIASFLGVGQFKYVLEQIGIEDAASVANITNVLSHQKVYRYQADFMNEDSEKLFKEIFEKLMAKYKFVLR